MRFSVNFFENKCCEGENIWHNTNMSDTIITWTAGNGANIKVSVRADYQLDGQGRRKTSGEMAVEITATVDGKQHACYLGIQPMTGHPVAVAKLGQIGLTPENLAKIQAAIDTAKASIAAHNEALATHAAALDSLGNGNINKVFGSDC
jgi:hypothetical protein